MSKLNSNRKLKPTSWLPAALLLCVALQASGCSIGIPGSGISKTEIRDVEPFRGIALSGVGEVRVSIGQPQNVEVIFDDNLMEIVETSVQNGKLRISTLKNYRSSLGLKVNITVPDLDSADVSGVGSLIINDLATDNIDFTLSGVGSLEANGIAKNVTVSVSGTGSAELVGLKAEIVKASVSGVGSAEVYASQSVSASASGVGDVKIHGNPTQVEQSSSGIGDVEMVN